MGNDRFCIKPAVFVTGILSLQTPAQAACVFTPGPGDDSYTATVAPLPVA